MAINVQTFKTRALTALFFVLFMLAGLFINRWTFIFLILLIMAGSLYELQKILNRITDKYKIARFFFACIYIVMPLSMLLDIGLSGNILSGNFTYNALIPSAILFSIWINDTMAYIVGSFIGKTAFSKISPKKTWEGTLGGAFLCVITVTLAGSFIPAAEFHSWYNWFMIALLCAFFGTLGDLLESKLKRMADVKDSGSFMPGHGGFLDRFDSLLLATPAIWLYMKFIC